MEEYEKNLLDLLRFVGFIKKDKVKIHKFLSGLPSFHKYKTQFDEPKTLVKTIRPSICMRKAKAEKILKKIRRIRRGGNQIREERDSNLLSIEIVLKDMSKNNQLKMNPN
jgi:hypothetical protein